MENSLLALALPPLLIVPAMGLLSRIHGRNSLHCELRRKALHVCVGLTSLSLPVLLTETWMVLVALALVAAWFGAVRKVPCLQQRFGGVLHDAGRESWGELYFALALAGLLLLADGNMLHFAIPVLILTMADAAAALVGRAWPVVALRGAAQGKTLSGSVAFVVTAFLVSSSLLYCYADLAVSNVFVIASLLALLTALAEAVSARGSDNLSVPLVAWLLLQFFITGGV